MGMGDRQTKRMAKRYRTCVQQAEREHQKWCNSRGQPIERLPLIYYYHGLRLRVHYDLPKHLALLQILVRGTEFAKREHAVDDWLQTPGKHMPQHFMQFAHGSHVRA